MVKLKDVCRHVRSKNAGPFWVTFDLLFDGPEKFRDYHAHPALGPDTFQRLYGADPALVHRYLVPSLNMVKISHARTSPQGGWSGTCIVVSSSCGCWMSSWHNLFEFWAAVGTASFQPVPVKGSLRA